MLSIDEAIAKYKEKANFYKQTTNIAYGLELEQLAEWLEELKVIKDDSIPIIHGKAELELHDKAIRNEAIDDFIHECDKHCEFYSGKNKSITREDILKIAEQLKEMNNE